MRAQSMPEWGTAHSSPRCSSLFRYTQLLIFKFSCTHYYWQFSWDHGRAKLTGRIKWTLIRAKQAPLWQCTCYNVMAAHYPGLAKQFKQLCVCESTRHVLSLLDTLHTLASTEQAQFVSLCGS